MFDEMTSKHKEKIEAILCFSGSKSLEITAKKGFNQK
jgi:hypothetical protein